MKSRFEETDLLNDKGLDEMQKAYAYKLAFKCFKALYWANTAFAFIPMIFRDMTNKSSFYAITTMLLFIVTNIIYLVFGAKASKVGALNTAFAKHMAKPGTILSFVMMFAIYIPVVALNFSKTHDHVFIYLGVFIAIMTVTHIALGYIANKNNKVVNETEEE